MAFIVSAAIILLILLLCAGKAKPKAKQPAVREAFPYRKNKRLFSPAERSFLGVLDTAVGDQYRVMGKVRVADIVSIKSQETRQQWQAAFNPIKAKHFDFVLCDKKNLSIVAVIELDDSSHKDARRKKRDVFLSGLCNAISLPIVRIPAQETYSPPRIKQEILETIEQKEASAA